MKRAITVAAAVAVAMALVVASGIWILARGHEPELPQISAYSNGQLVRVGPYRYCKVLNPTDCEVPKDYGELRVDRGHTVQLSVPPEIARAPWVLVRSYEGADVVDEFRPDTRSAVTIPTVDPRRGRLFGMAVQLPTLIRDEAGNEFPVPHAEWSVGTVWS